MSVDRAEVERIAALARLRLEEAEVDSLTEEMNQILEHARRLRGLETGGEPSVVSPSGSGPAGTRTEEAEAPDRLYRPLTDFAPRMEGGFFLVPPPPGVTRAEDAPASDVTHTEDPQTTSGTDAS